MASPLRNEQNLAVARVVLNVSQCVLVLFERVGCGDVRTQDALVDELDELAVYALPAALAAYRGSS
jgi:hypothetical protein